MVQLVSSWKQEMWSTLVSNISKVVFELFARITSYLEATVQVVSSEKFKHNGFQCMIFTDSIQHKYIKVPQVQMLERENKMKKSLL